MTTLGEPTEGQMPLLFRATYLLSYDIDSFPFKRSNFKSVGVNEFRKFTWLLSQEEEQLP